MTTGTCSEFSGTAAGLTAADMMETRVITVPATAPLAELERLLTEHRISGMPVVAEDDSAVGVVSYRDLLDHYAENADERPSGDDAYFRETRFLLDGDFDALSGYGAHAGCAETVADIMTPALIDVVPDAPLAEVVRTMVKHSVHRVLVIEPGTRRVVGIISSLGVLAAIAE